MIQHNKSCTHELKGMFVITFFMIEATILGQILWLYQKCFLNFEVNLP